MLSASEVQNLEQDLSELQQKCLIKLQQLQEQRQGETLQQLDEKEAEEIAEAERRRQEQEERRREIAEERKAAKLALKSGEENEGADDESVDSLSLQGESDDGKKEEEVIIPPALSRECVVEAIAAQATLEAFNDEVLTPLKENLSLSE